MRKAVSLIEEPAITAETVLPVLRYLERTTTLKRPAGFASQPSFVASFASEIEDGSDFGELKIAFLKRAIMATDPTTGRLDAERHKRNEVQTRGRTPTSTLLRALIARQNTHDLLAFVMGLDKRLQSGETARTVVVNLHRSATGLLCSLAPALQAGQSGTTQRRNGGPGQLALALLWCAVFLAWEARLFEAARSIATGERRSPSTFVPALDQMGRDFLRRCRLIDREEALTGLWPALRTAVANLNGLEKDGLRLAQVKTARQLATCLEAGTPNTEQAWCRRLKGLLEPALDRIDTELEALHASKQASISSNQIYKETSRDVDKVCHSFADVVGRANVVEGLRHIVLCPIPVVLLHGPEGAGKRSMARLLANALQCEEPTPLGDACGRCGACHENAGAGHFSQFALTITAANAEERATYIAKQIELAPWAKRWVITVIDADRTPERVLDQFLSVFDGTHDKSSSRLTIVLLTQDLTRLRPAVVSRCWQFAMRPLSPEHASELLARWLTRLGRQPDKDCIDLLLGKGRNLPKLLAQACTAYAGLGDPTPADVRAALMPAWADVVVAHCRALLQVWPATYEIVVIHEQDASIADEPERSKTKHEQRRTEPRHGVRTCLTAVYLHGLQHVPIGVGITESALLIEPDKLHDLTQAFLQCAARNGLPARELWAELTRAILVGDSS